MTGEQRILLRLIDGQTAANRCLDMFLLHQEASRNSPRTIETYRETLTPFLDYLSDQDITQPELITPTHIRRFFVLLEERGRQGVLEGFRLIERS